jgi:uncharacterized protein YrrD
MIHSVTALRGYAIHATDGEIGKIEDCYFDDEMWTLRYLVVRTGSWLFGKEVLLSPVVVERIDFEHREIICKISSKQVENSPSVETEKPISKQQEQEFSRYFGYPVYWGGAGFWGDAMHPGALFFPVDDESREEERGENEGDHHLRSIGEVCGYRVWTGDERIGKVQDFHFDDATWIIRYLEVHTGGIIRSREVLFSPRWVSGVDWAQAEVSVNLKKEQVENAPTFDPSLAITREYEEALFSYYGEGKYWDEESK